MIVQNIRILNKTFVKSKKNKKNKKQQSPGGLAAPGHRSPPPLSRGRFWIFGFHRMFCVNKYDELFGFYNGFQQDFDFLLKKTS